MFVNRAPREEDQAGWGGNNGTEVSAERRGPIKRRGMASSPSFRPCEHPKRQVPFLLHSRCAVLLPLHPQRGDVYPAESDVLENVCRQITFS